MSRLLPNGDANLLFDLGPAGSWRSPLRPREGTRALALGPVRRAVPVDFGPCVDLLGVAFSVGRARSFLGVEVARLTDRAVSLGDLWGEHGAELEKRLRRVSCRHGQVAILRGALRARLPRRPSEDGDLGALVRHVVERRGDVRVTELARSSGVSRQHLTRWFTRRVGVGPKAFARLTRFEALLGRVTGAPEPRWIDVAGELGYSDQAHMITDFRHHTGMSPARFRRAHLTGARP